MVLFPAPVSPVTDVIEPGRKSYVKFLSTGSQPSGYENVTLENLIPGTPLSLIGSPCSSNGIPVSSHSLSTLDNVLANAGICRLRSTTGLCTMDTSWRNAAISPKLTVPAARPFIPLSITKRYPPENPA